MDDTLLLLSGKKENPKLIIVQGNQTWTDSSRRSLLKTVLTICFAGVLGLAGIYVSWMGPDCWMNNDADITTSGPSTSHIFSGPQCSVLPPFINRFDCWPGVVNGTKDRCEARGCCWKPVLDSQRSGDVPWCFYPSNYQLYTVQSLQKSSTGMTAQLVSSSSSGWPSDIRELKLDIVYETFNRLHFKIYDPNNKRFEVPIDVSRVDTPVSDTDYVVDVPSSGPFYITVTRKSTGKILFSSQSVAPLVFADQFIQFGTHLSSQFIYGLGEHMDKFAISTKWNKLVLWARDQHVKTNANLYGSHPFYLNIEEDHNAHGVFLLNSNAMEIELQETPALTYRTLGGILDFYIFTGPTPDSVVQQYTGLIGRSFMPPYWALGFHLCRWGYKTSDELKRVINRMREAKMPYDTQWTDIDYMRSELDWTYDVKGRYPLLPDVIRDLHDNGQHYIILVVFLDPLPLVYIAVFAFPNLDPGISNKQKSGSYPPFDDGMEQDVFIKKHDGSGPIVGKVWPGTTVFPDFFHPNASQYWTDQARSLFEHVHFDGLWIDMNEISSAFDGSEEGCTSSSLDNPPFTPSGIVGGDLKSNTLCPSAIQYLSTQYNLHSLYGHSEAVVTKRTLDTLLGNKRSIVISRSSFPSTGVHSGHWLGDNNAEWDHTYYSITGVLSFQLFGISLIGADICGFMGNTTPELCARWMQLGAFYPFMRNHNSYGQQDQDPAVFDAATQDIMRDALNIRYTLLPYLYTLFYRTHVNGTAIVRPLFFQYPESADNVIYNVDAQFMWGTCLLITPVLSENTTKGKGYLPKDRWYDYFDFTHVDSPGEFVIFNLPMEHLNIQVRGGSVIPMQHPNVTTTLARKNKFMLLTALSPESTASGELYWDDGISRDSMSIGKYNLITFQSYQKTLSSNVLMSGYTDEPMLLGEVRILGVELIPTGVSVNGQVITSYKYQDSTRNLYIYNLNVDLLQPFHISWK